MSNGSEFALRVALCDLVERLKRSEHQCKYLEQCRNELFREIVRLRVEKESLTVTQQQQQHHQQYGQYHQDTHLIALEDPKTMKTAINMKVNTNNKESNHTYISHDNAIAINNNYNSNVDVKLMPRNSLETQFRLNTNLDATISSNHELTQSKCDKRRNKKQETDESNEENLEEITLRLIRELKRDVAIHEHDHRQELEQKNGHEHDCDHANEGNYNVGEEQDYENYQEIGNEETILCEDNVLYRSGNEIENNSRRDKRTDLLEKLENTSDIIGKSRKNKICNEKDLEKLMKTNGRQVEDIPIASELSDGSSSYQMQNHVSHDYSKRDVNQREQKSKQEKRMKECSTSFPLASAFTCDATSSTDNAININNHIPVINDDHSELTTAFTTTVSSLKRDLDSITRAINAQNEKLIRLKAKQLRNYFRRQLNEQDHVTLTNFPHRIDLT